MFSIPTLEHGFLTCLETRNCLLPFPLNIYVSTSSAHQEKVEQLIAVINELNNKQTLNNYLFITRIRWIFKQLIWHNLSSKGRTPYLESVIHSLYYLNLMLYKNNDSQTALYLPFLLLKIIVLISSYVYLFNNFNCPEDIIFFQDIDNLVISTS